MGTLHRAYWVSEGLGRTKRQRASGGYSWYLPDRLSTLDLSLSADVIGDVVRAEKSVVLLNENDRMITHVEGIARLLLRSEAVASSHIEGLTIGAKRLLRAELYGEEPDNLRYDRHAVDVIGNVHAMEEAIRMASAETSITVATLLNIHRTLCKGTRLESIGGTIRQSQNWVGGSPYNPLGADYVPPSYEEVPALLDDLADFCNRSDISAIEQAAIAHSQFESIHPFGDGNGRTGRALIHVILRRRGLASRFVPPVSLLLATNRQEYLACLSEMHFGSDEIEQRESLAHWVSFFADCVALACDEGEMLERELSAMRKRWEAQLGNVRAGSALKALLAEMQGVPVFTVASMVKLINMSQPAVGAAINRCVSAGIVVATNKGKRNRVFEVPEMISQFTAFERRLASPEGNTRLAPPNRAVPYRASES